MPLTDREKRILEEIEKNLVKEDRGRAQGGRSPRHTAIGRMRWGGALFIAGLLTLVAFFVVRHTLVGLTAFGLMVTGVFLVVGGASALAGDQLDSLQTRERAIGAIRRWERAMRDRFKRS